LRILHCTIASNYAVRKAGGLVLDESEHSGADVFSSIFWGNRGEVGGGQILDSAHGSELIFCDIEGGWSGTGDQNCDADPIFIDPLPALRAPTSRGNYHLGSESPCIDVADNGGEVDIDDEARPWDGDLDGTALHDIGADEYIIERLPTSASGENVSFINGEAFSQGFALGFILPTFHVGAFGRNDKKPFFPSIPFQIL
jgi:hypothetical protein